MFDWGLVDVSHPLALGARFLAGRPIYRLSIQAYRDMVRDYAAHSRPIQQERLWLDRRERARLVRRLVEHARPEHRPYRYDPLRRNCVTRIRDVLDEAVAGRIADQLAVRGHGTLREQILSAVSDWPFIVLGLDIVVNAEVDRPVSLWEELFVPEKLREHLRAVSASLDAAAPAASLLGEAERLLAAPERRGPARFGEYLIVSGLGVLVLAGLAHTRWAPRRLHVRIVGAGIFGFGLLSALLSTLMAVAWIVSRLSLLHHNANLWLFWPVDWVVAVFGLSLMVTGEPWPSDSRRGRWVRRLVQAHLLGAGVFVILWAGGIIQQAVTPVIVGFVPLAGLIYGSAWLALTGVPSVAGRPFRSHPRNPMAWR